MKIYSDTAVTKGDIDAVDAKQTEQINKLRVLLAASFAFNTTLTLLLYFTR